MIAPGTAAVTAGPTADDLNDVDSPNLPESVEFRQNIIDTIQDSLNVERDWRTQGRSIQQIYRGQLNSWGKTNLNSVRFNSLNSNTSILLPSVFSKPPKPSVSVRGPRARPEYAHIAEALEGTAASILDTTEAFDAMQAAVKEVLLPGRGVCRIRWNPIVEEKTFANEDGSETVIYEKLLDQIFIEHVYWENFTFEAVDKWENVGWIAFRHLFTKEKFLEAFKNYPAVKKLIAENKFDAIFKWTDRSAAFNNSPSTNSTVGSRPNVSSNGLQDQIQKALVWEYWDKSNRVVTWICQDADAIVLKTDEDPYTLEGFFPVPSPLLAVTTTDQLLPVPEYAIYQDLAQEIELASDRIAALVPRLKVRGAYNSSQEELSGILTADDGVMVAVAGADYNFDLSQHIYLVSIAEHIQALQALYVARDSSKQAMYEITGISDIVRGSSKASETLGAQQMKSQFANIRISDRRQMVEFFCRDLIRLICEIIAEHYSAESIFYATGISLDPATMQLMRAEGLRPANIDVESDSTVLADAASDQEAMGQLTQSMAMVLQQVFPMVQQGIMPLPIAMEMVKMVTKPFKYSSNLHDMIDASMAQMQAQPPAVGTSQSAQGAPASGANVVPGPGAVA